MSSVADFHEAPHVVLPTKSRPPEDSNSEVARAVGTFWTFPINLFKWFSSMDLFHSSSGFIGCLPLKDRRGVHHPAREPFPVSLDWEKICFYFSYNIFFSARWKGEASVLEMRPRSCLEEIKGDINPPPMDSIINFIFSGLIAGSVWAKIWPGQQGNIIVGSSLYDASMKVL